MPEGLSRTDGSGSVPGRDRPLRVVSITHTGYSRAFGRLRYEPLVGDPGLDLTLVVPERWQEYGNDYRADPPLPGLDIRVEPVRLLKAGPALWYLHHYPRLGRLLREANPDVIHLWEEPWSVIAAQAEWLRTRYLPDTALVLETDQNILRRMPPPFEQMRRRALSRTDLLIGRAEEALAVCRACGYDGPTDTVEYGADHAVFRPGDRDAARAEFGASGLTVGYVGRLVPEKGLLEVLDAMAASRTPTTLLVLGTGPQRDELVGRAAELGLSERLKLFNPRPPAEVARFMSSLDALVLMSRTMRTWKEQFGRVIMEAQACAVPVIGSSSGSIPGVVDAGGWIVPEGDAPALAKLLDHLGDNPGELRAKGERGRQDALRRFTYETVAAALHRAWTRAAAARRARRE